MDRKLAADELATFLATLGHPLRIRIIEELRGKELDVTSIYEALKEKQSKVSQQLSILRTQKMIVERREGRRIFYKIANEALPDWLLDGLNIIQDHFEENKKIKNAIKNAKKIWQKDL